MSMPVLELLRDQCKEAKDDMKALPATQLGSWERAVTVSDGAWLTRGHHSRNHTYSLRNFINNSLLYFKHFCMQGYKTDAPYLDKDDQDLYQSINRFILWLVVVNRQTHAVSTFRLAYLSNSCTR